MEVIVREFEFNDIPKKVDWINDSYNNKYLHYNLPLEIKKTEEWFLKNIGNKNRYDATILANGKPVGIIGLVNIDYKKRQGEYYITIGDRFSRGKGIAYKASKILLDYAFNQLDLEKIYLTTEQGNKGMQKLANRIGMLRETLLMNHSMRNGKLYHVYYYSVSKNDYKNRITYPNEVMSDIEYLNEDFNGNSIYMKRDDLISFSFGGNKARKAKYFFEEILSKGYQTVITYGSNFSNHVRVIASLCKKNNLECIVVSPNDTDEENLNRELIKMNGAKIVTCSINEVSETIDKLIDQNNEKNGNKTFFIPGGGHGNFGTQAYLDAYHEIEIWTRRHRTNFDYIFLASGTGTTQAGLIIGNELHRNDTEIIGISVARDEKRGAKVIEHSIYEYLKRKNSSLQNKEFTINFYDDLTVTNYGKSDDYIDNTLIEIYNQFGIGLSRAYTGKAYAGMKEYINKYNIQNKNILFINTGGIPLFFNDILKIDIEKRI